MVFLLLVMSGEKGNNENATLPKENSKSLDMLEHDNHLYFEPQHILKALADKINCSKPHSNRNMPGIVGEKFRAHFVLSSFRRLNYDFDCSPYGFMNISNKIKYI